MEAALADAGEDGAPINPETASIASVTSLQVCYMRHAFQNGRENAMSRSDSH